MTETTPAAVTDGKPGVARYRKRPVVIEAVQWTGDNDDEVQEFAGIRADNGDDVFQIFHNIDDGTRQTVLWTVKSRRYCEFPVGAWAIRETDGSGFYPCAGDVFAATYEPADAASFVAAALDRDAVAAVLRKQLGTADFQAREVAGQICALMGSGSEEESCG